MHTYWTLLYLESEGLPIHPLPSGADLNEELSKNCLVRDKLNDNFYITTDTNYLQIQNKIKVHKSKNSSTLELNQDYVNLVLDSVEIDSDYVDIENSEIVVKKSGVYSINCCCEIKDVDLVLEAGSYISNCYSNNDLIDFVEINEGELVKIKAKSTNGQTLSVPQNSIKIFIENR